MDKLEVGKWYRQSEEPEGYLYLYKGKDGEKETASPPHYPYYRFDRYVDGKIDQINMPVSKTYIHLYQNKLETLTSEEALILLAKKFVLIKKTQGYLVKINSDGLLLNKRFDDINWELCFLSDYSDFKIHALPEGENG